MVSKYFLCVVFEKKAGKWHLYFNPIMVLIAAFFYFPWA